MTRADVVEICSLLEAAGIDVWIDGGWGVDALLECQTRDHSDLDIAVAFDQAEPLRATLGVAGFVHRPRADDRDCSFVLADARGRAVDVHVFVRDAMGNGILGDPVDESAYPADAFTGRGVIGEMPVRCIAAPVVIGFRSSFPPRPVDRHDVALLCEAFGLPLPAPFRS